MAYANSEREREYHRKYYVENREVMRARMKLWREKNIDQYRARSRAYRERNREEIEAKRREQRKLNPKYFNDQKRRSKYGLEAEQYDAMLKSQKHCCAVCGEKRKLVVDHNHQTNAVRELVCSPCNTAIGLLQEDTKRIWRVVEYLTFHKRRLAS